MDQITTVTAIVALATAIASLVLGVLNHTRDRARVKVQLQWDMSVTEGPGGLDPEKDWGFVNVVNVGRRPVYITSVYLVLPKSCRPRNLLLTSSLFGPFSPKRLEEGDPTACIPTEQEGMEEHAGYWKKIRAVALDSTGRKYRSRKVSKRPSWAK